MNYKNEKLEEFNRFLSKSRVAIIGLGVSNLPLLDYLHDLGSNVTVFDNKEVEKIDQVIVDKLRKYNMSFYFGSNSLDNLKGFNIIFRSPSCLPTTTELVVEANNGAIVTTEIEMVLELAPCKTIGITGSDGKTTTTTLISEILKEDGYNVFLGGNIGKPIFTEIGNMKPEDVVVVELSSFQLMDMKTSPDIAVVTNITPNHLDIHKDMDEYINAKKNIFAHQDSNGVLIINYDNEITNRFYSQANGKAMYFSSKVKLDDGYIYDPDDEKIKVCENGLRKHIYDTRNMKLRGVHNFENACCAIMATKDLVKPESVVNVLNNFKGVEHRLELILETENRVKWYNDSVSSSPTRTMAGLNAFALRNIILIAGGYDKHLDYTVMAKPIIDNCKGLVLLGQTADKIDKAVTDELKKQNKTMPIARCTSLVEAITEADKLSQKGDIVLFSPASASFDMFKNFAERGELFKENVKKMIK